MKQITRKQFLDTRIAGILLLLVLVFAAKVSIAMSLLVTLLFSIECHLIDSLVEKKEENEDA